MPLFVFHPERAIVIRGFPAHAAVQSLHRNFQVIRVCQLHPGFKAVRCQFINGVTEHFCPGMIKNGFVGLNVPFPGPLVSTFNDELQTLMIALRTPDQLQFIEGKSQVVGNLDEQPLLFLALGILVGNRNSQDPVGPAAEFQAMDEAGMVIVLK